MKADQYWSVEYDSAVSRTFAANYKPEPKKTVKIDITKCEIVRNKYGFYYLYLKGKRLRKITFEEFLKYRGYVIRITDYVEN